MRVLVIGKNGQLAWELARTCPANIECIALARDELDLADATSIASGVAQYRPAAIINAAAYTAVDKAESERDTAFAVNAEGVKQLAQICQQNAVRLLHVSTDFVFGGQQNTPYLPDDSTAPEGVYGASKLAGEHAVRDLLPEHSVIVRTAWVYSSHAHNFVKTMLRLMTEKPALNVVYDQVGTPTWARGLAHWLWAVCAKPGVTGTYHWTDAGVASWYDFAVAIQTLGLAKGLLKQAIPISPIPTSSYPLPAKRPAYSVLDKTTALAVSGIAQVHWQQQLSAMLDELKQTS